MPAAEPDTEGDERQIAEVRYRIVALNMGKGVPAGALALGLVCFGLTLGGPLDWGLVVPWGLFVLAVLAVYYLIAPLRARWLAQGRQDRWLRLLLAYNVLIGTAWGLSGPLFFAAEPVRLLVLVLLQVGMMLSVVSASAVLPLAAALNLVPCALPLVVRAVLDDAPLSRLAGLAVLLLLVLMLAYGHAFSRALLESIRMRHENRRLNEALTEQRVRERTAVLEAASAHKSAFLATVSHEIRTPMNAIIGMGGLLLDTPLNAEQRDYAATIRDSGETLLTLINDILDFSKIEAGRMEVESQPFDLRDCVESALGLVAPRAAEKQLDLAYEPEGELPGVLLGDVTRLRQVLLNLLSNAVKFTEVGEVVVNLRQEGGMLHFTVRDTGIGLSEEGMSRLFQSFSQADSSTTRKYGGTGLGLAISRNLVELMGGRMWAESRGPGWGSRFHFTLPARATEAMPSLRRELLGAQPALKGLRMLVVDDNATNRRILTLQAGKWGMVVRDTESPLEALQLALSETFDIAVLDMHMPHMDGVELARRLRDLKPALPRVLFTSLGRHELEEGLFAATMMKPLSQGQLFDTLVAVLGREQLVQPVQEPQQGARLDADLARRYPLRILLAEDNAVNQKIALQLLARLGYRADLAANGLEALEGVQRQPYDLVLMDVQMPEMDGLQATRLIRERLGASAPRIVALTANAMQSDLEACLVAGMDGCVAKPVRVEELVLALIEAAQVGAKVGVNAAAAPLQGIVQSGREG